MYYGSGTGEHSCIYARKTLCVHSPDGSTFLREMTLGSPSWKYDVISEIRPPSIYAYLLKERVHRISSQSSLKRRSLRLFRRGRPNKNSKTKGKGKRYCIAVNGSIPWHSCGVSCHMGPLSVTYYSTQVNTPRFNPSHAGRYSIYPLGRDGRLSWPSWLDSAPAGSRTSDLSITSPTPNRYTTKTSSDMRSVPDPTRSAAASHSDVPLFCSKYDVNGWLSE